MVGSQLCVEIDSILNGEGGVDAEVQASIEQLAQKLYDNVSSSDQLCDNYAMLLLVEAVILKCHFLVEVGLKPGGAY